MKNTEITNLWNSYADILWEPGQHKETCRGYVHEIQDIVDRHRIEAYDNRLVDVVVASLRAKGNKNSTINRKLACLSKLLRKHHRAGAINRLPDLQKLPERNGRIRFLSRDEEAFLFACLDTIDVRYGNLGRFLVDTGARVGEALGLAWSDVHQGTVTFWETKANTPRSVPLTNRALDVLRNQRGSSRTGPFAEIRYANFRNA